MVVMERETLRPGEVARMLGVGDRTVQNLFNAEKLDGFRIPSTTGKQRGHMRIFRSSVMELMKSRDSAGGK